jgi:hypothetical protein
MTGIPAFGTAEDPEPPLLDFDVIRADEGGLPANTWITEMTHVPGTEYGGRGTYTATLNQNATQTNAGQIYNAKLRREVTAALPAALASVAGASYRLTYEDADLILNHSHSASAEIELPAPNSIGLVKGQVVTIRRGGEYALTLVPDSGVGLEAAATSIAARYQMVALLVVGPTTWSAVGALS